MLKLDELRPERLDYLGVSFGATESLFKFWKRCNFAPVYLRQTQVMQTCLLVSCSVQCSHSV